MRFLVTAHEPKSGYAPDMSAPGPTTRRATPSLAVSKSTTAAPQPSDCRRPRWLKPTSLIADPDSALRGRCSRAAVRCYPRITASIRPEQARAVTPVAVWVLRATDQPRHREWTWTRAHALTRP